MSDIDELLTSTKALASMSRESLARLAAQSDLQTIAAGTSLLGQDEPSDALYIVTAGRFQVVMRDQHAGQQVVGEVGPGDLVGEVQVIVGGASTASLTALTTSRVLRLDRRAFEEEIEAHPQALAAMIGGATRRLLAQRLLSSLSRALGSIDGEQVRELAAGAEWLRLQRGETLFRQGEVADAAYLVVSGLLLASIDRGASGGSGERVLGEVGSGELVGEVALISDECRAATVTARRPSWLVRIDRQVFAELVLTKPQRLLPVVRVLTARQRSADKAQALRDHTIALLPLSSQAPAGALAHGLAPLLQRWSRVAIMSADAVRGHGLVPEPRTTDPEHPAWLRLDVWLEERRRDATTVMLLGDHDDNPWTRKVVAEADRIVLVGEAGDPPVVTAVEESLFASESGAIWEPRRWLVLMHGEHTALPHATAAWLNARKVERHFHLRTGDSSHLARLARWLAGQSVGVAMSGGGARGFAHIGVYKALQEAQLPVDFIAGTSCGALMGALLAAGHEAEALAALIRRRVTGKRNPFGDLTLPLMSLLRSRRIRAFVTDAFGDIRLEDLWIPCAVVTTDLTAARRAVFMRGPVWQAGLASSSPPGVTLPVLLDGSVHCDGSVLDNLPVSVLAEHGCRYRIASNVGTELDLAVTRQEWPSPWELAFDRLFRSGRHSAGIPNIMEILMRAITLAGDREQTEAIAGADLLLQPPVRSFSLLDFLDPEPVAEAGYRYASEHLASSPQASRIRAALEGQQSVAQQETGERST